MSLQGLTAVLAAAATLAAQDTAALRVRVVEGAGVVYPVGSRSARGITVEVADEAGRPVEGAAVSFLLPGSGPSGIFASGSRTEIATTRADGQASVFGMRWNQSAGPVQIRIAAAKGLARGDGICTVVLTTAMVAAQTTRPANGGGRNYKWLWITLAIAGGAGGAVAAGGLGTRPASPAAAAIATPTTIGAPSVSLGRP